jgi:clan AA aspartic protease
VIGQVDEAGRAILQFNIRSTDVTQERKIVAWIDTAFDGELVIPTEIVEELDLEQSGLMRATLADGRDVMLESYHCLVDWFGNWRSVEVIANEGRLPLLGIGLLLERKLFVDYAANTLRLE